MIPLIKHYLWAFFFDQNAAKRFMVGLGAMVANVILAIIVFGFSTIESWNGKTMLQHIVFALASTITTMLPGPAIAKPPDGLGALPPRGFTNFLWVASIGSGVFQALILGLALHTLGLNAHPWALLCLAAGGAQGWFVWRSLK